MELRQRCLCMRIGFLFIMFFTVFVLGYEKPIRAASQHIETDPNSEETATEKSSAPASAPPVKPKEITFELIKSIKFADGTEVKSITKSDVEALRDLPIDMGGNKTDGVTLTKSRDDKVHVRTCREYDAALEEGYYPSSTYDISMGSWFKYPCGTLNLLEIATVPQQSFIPTSKEKVFDLKLIPLSLFPIMTDYEQRYGYNIENVTYQDQVEKRLLKVTDMEQNKLICEDDGLRQHLTEVARADFNGDDIEDVLLSEAVHATQGTYRTYNMIILTRKSMDGKFEKVELHDSE
ncbi:hypothetical protein F4X33_19745 [Candidatus Poribacteria bacterium]|nr:hypothetical protein [Candidatus Poribacteria bacterium]